MRDETSRVNQSIVKAKRVKKPAQLKVRCWICGAAAADHLHYGAICCYSCRAFFRRSGHRNYTCIDNEDSCNITPENRKQCKKCRYKQCLAVGMKPDLVDATLDRRLEVKQQDDAECTSTLSDDNNTETFEGKLLKPNAHQLNIMKDDEVNIDEILGGNEMSDLEEIPMRNEDPSQKSRRTVEEDMQVKDNEMNIHQSNQISVIRKVPPGWNAEFPSSFTNTFIPFKKRESSKEWVPYCQRLSLSPQDSPTIQLTIEESLFIEQRVYATKSLVQTLHENCVKYLDQNEAYKTNSGFQLENDHCVEIFRAKAGEIFCKTDACDESKTVEEIYKTNLIKSRFLCCSMAAVAVRLFGGPDVDCFPHDHMFYQKYRFLLQSPWASSLEQEREVVNTLRMLGNTIKSDKKMEVLFTSALMRGFRDMSEPSCDSSSLNMKNVQRSLACRLPDSLSGTQFSLLLFRYLKNTRPQEEANAIFQTLEGLIPYLYTASNTFYYERLNL